MTEPLGATPSVIKSQTERSYVTPGLWGTVRVRLAGVGAWAGAGFGAFLGLSFKVMV
jgi:hypothetical protein